MAFQKICEEQATDGAPPKMLRVPTPKLLKPPIFPCLLWGTLTRLCCHAYFGVLCPGHLPKAKLGCFDLGVSMGATL